MLIMRLFGKNDVDLNFEDKKIVESFSPRLNVLLTITDNEEVKKSLLELNDAIEYLPVSPKTEVLKIDNKIMNSLDDLKIALIENRDNIEILKLIKSISILIAERRVIY